MDHILSITILDGYTFIFSSCNFNGNIATISPLIVTDQTSVSYSGTPSTTNLQIQDSNFTSNQGLTDSGSFKIMNNSWLIVQISGSRFESNSGPLEINHYIGDISQLTITNTNYLSVDPGSSTGITASVLHKSNEYTLTMSTVSVS